jgi:hypothetical protein
LDSEAPPFGLNVKAFRPQRRWALDNLTDGYHKRLPPEEALWLERFNREYYGADAKSLNSPDALHNTVDLRRDCYRLQNYATRDVVSLGLVGEDHSNKSGMREDVHTRQHHDVDFDKSARRSRSRAAGSEQVRAPWMYRRRGE